MEAKISQLENKLTIATDTINNFETVSLGLFVNIGSVNENSKQVGISHFLEHMAFKGTEKRTALEISYEIESVGGFINAFTSKEMTAFHVKVLKDNVNLAVDIISDIVQNSTFDKIEFEKERGVIIQEIRQLNDAPDDLVFDIFQSKCFEGEKLGTQILGSEKDILSYFPDDLDCYMKSKYTTDKMIFVASGNIEHESLKNLVEKYTPKLHSFNVPSVETQVYKGGFIFKQKKLEQTHLIYGLKGLSHTDDNKFALSVLTTILGGGMSSRLFQEVREKRGLVYSIFAFNSNYKDTGTFGIYAACEDKKAKEVIDIIRFECGKIAEDISEEELQKAKTQLKASLLMGLESSSTRMERLANQILLHKKISTPAETAQKIENIQLDSVKNLINQILKSKPTLAVIGNGKDIENLYEF
ncbi:MAG: pitrilysin family protein [Alphaproteobacteria bacterium]|nr:pitrilysin family protein [Alphaproteobacteria bacterium]